MTLPNRQVISRKLPASYEQGYVLRLENTDADHLTLTVTLDQPAGRNGVSAGPLAAAHGAGHPAELLNGQASLVVDKTTLLDGVSHFTLFNADRKPRVRAAVFPAAAARAGHHGPRR